MLVRFRSTSRYIFKQTDMTNGQTPADWFMFRNHDFHADSHADIHQDLGGFWPYMIAGWWLVVGLCSFYFLILLGLGLRVHMSPPLIRWGMVSPQHLTLGIPKVLNVDRWKQLILFFVRCMTIRGGQVAKSPGFDMWRTTWLTSGNDLCASTVIQHQDNLWEWWIVTIKKLDI